MKPTLTHKLVLSALSLSLAACATPVATAPATTAPAATDAAAPAAPATMPGEAAPAPAVAPASAMAVTGTATFQGEPLVGYAVRAFNPLTGAELALATPVVTDGAGKFNATVNGLAAGQLVRFVAAKAHVSVEATAHADATVAIDEASTVASLVSAGPLQVAGLMSADQAAPVADAYLGVLDGLHGDLATQLKTLNSSAVRIVQVPEGAEAQDDFETAIESVLANTGKATAVNDATYALLEKVAAAPHANRFATFSVQDLNLSFVRFLGTKLKVSVGGTGETATFQVTNVKTGKTVDAKNASASTIKTVAKTFKSHHKFSGPFTPQFLSRYADPTTNGVPLFISANMGEVMPYHVLGAPSPLPYGAWGAFFTTGAEEDGQRYVDLNVVRRRHTVRALNANEENFQDAFEHHTTPIGRLTADQLARWTKPVVRYYISNGGDVQAVGRFKRELIDELADEPNEYHVLGLPKGLATHRVIAQVYPAVETRPEAITQLPFPIMLPGMVNEERVDAYAFEYDVSRDDNERSVHVVSGFGLNSTGILVGLDGLNVLLGEMAPEEMLDEGDIFRHYDFNAVRFLERLKLPPRVSIRLDAFFPMFNPEIDLDR